MNLKLFLKLALDILHKPKAVALSVDSINISSNKSLVYFVGVNILVGFIFSLFYLTPLYTDYGSEEMLAQSFIDSVWGHVTYIVSSFIIAIVTFKALSYFSNKEVLFPRFLLIVTLLSFASIINIVPETLMVLTGNVDFFYFLTILVVVYLLALLVTVEAKIFAIKEWKVVLINTVVFIGLSTLFGLVGELF